MKHSERGKYCSSMLGQPVNTRRWHPQTGLIFLLLLSPKQLVDLGLLRTSNRHRRQGQSREDEDTSLERLTGRWKQGVILQTDPKRSCKLKGASEMLHQPTPNITQTTREDHPAIQNEPRVLGAPTSNHKQHSSGTD